MRQMFEASGEPADFTPYFDLNRVFRRGETTALCMAALKADRPLDTRQLALGPSAGRHAGAAHRQEVRNDLHDDH